MLKKKGQKKAVVLCSGGADSSTLLAKVVDDFGVSQVESLCVYYGQKHERELKSAKDIASFYGVTLSTLNLSSIFQESTCSLLKHSEHVIAQESYAEQLQENKGCLLDTYVPFRNGLFISAAASFALSRGADILLYGAHADDAAGNAYPDCSCDFIRAMAEAVSIGTEASLELQAPFSHYNKADIIRLGLQLGVPYELTWSCYEGGDKPCGICGTCRDRQQAFEANNAIDPLLEL